METREKIATVIGVVICIALFLVVTLQNPNRLGHVQSPKVTRQVNNHSHQEKSRSQKSNDITNKKEN